MKTLSVSRLTGALGVLVCLVGSISAQDGGTPNPGADPALPPSAPRLPVISVVATVPRAAEPSDTLPPLVDAAEFTVERAVNLGGPLRVAFELGGTAQNGEDYVATEGWVAFADGEARRKVRILPIKDRLIEGEETVVLALKPATTYTLGEPSAAKVILADASLAGNVLPRVKFTRPAREAAFTAPATVELEVAAQDPDGYVPKVEFFANHDKLGESVLAFPHLVDLPPIGAVQVHKFVWTAVKPGTYALTARATDNRGGVATSDPIRVRVGEDADLPLVTVQATLPTAIEPAGPDGQGETGVVVLSRTGSVERELKVSLAFSGTASAGEDYRPLEATVVFAVGQKERRIEIVPLHDPKVEEPETVVISVQPDPTYRLGDLAAAKVLIHDALTPGRATLTITAPKSGATFTAPAAVVIEATAVDPLGDIRLVEFFANGQSIGKSQFLAKIAVIPGNPIPHRLEWNVVAAGHYRIVARAKDTAGKAVESAPLELDVQAAGGDGLVLLKRGSDWRYQAEGAPPKDGWRIPEFDDSAWPSGPAQLGYGDGDEATVLKVPTPRPLAAYFRGRFEVPADLPLKQVVLRLVRDDGAVVYLNGQEVVRDNMPEGVITAETPAAATTAEENAWRTFELDPKHLRVGRNTVAVEVHQASATSSDLSFDLELAVLAGADPHRPRVRLAATHPETAEPSPTTRVAPGVFRISRTGGLSLPFTVLVRFGGTATPGKDYELEPAAREGALAVLIPAGTEAAEVKVFAIDDEWVEPDETVVARLVVPPSQGLAPLPYDIDPAHAEAVVTIHDTDEPPAPGRPVVTLEASVPETVEPSPNTRVRPGVFRLGRSGDPAAELTVWCEIGGTAEMGKDYTLGAPVEGGRLVVKLAAGAAAAEILVMPIEDALVEGDETVVARLTHLPTASPLPPPYEIDPKHAEARVVIHDANAPPPVASLRITHPRAGAAFPAGKAIEILATAIDPQGAIYDVAFYAGDRLLGVSAIRTLVALPPGSPVQHRWVWEDAPAGKHVLTARAGAPADNLFKLVSEPVPIQVEGPPPPAGPTLAIVAPPHHAVFEAPATIRIDAVATDPKGYMSRVEFFAGRERIGVSEVVFIRAPDPGTPIEHQFEWQAVPPGTYSLTAVSTTSAGVALASKPVSVTVREKPVPTFAVRDLPDTYLPGTALVVSLQATPPATTAAYAVEDTPPAGWTVSAISDEGAFDAARGKVKFGPYTDAKARTLTYTVLPPVGAQGRQEFIGTGSIDGRNSRIGGDQVVAILRNRHPADLSVADDRLTIGELAAYAAAWQRGEPWSVAPNPIPVDYLTRAATLWKTGEGYRYDPAAGDPPLCWVSLAPTGTRPTLNSVVPASQVARALPAWFVGGQAVTVRLDVQPAAGTVAYALEELPPAGWAVSAISHEGVFDAVNARIKWGPFYGDAPRVLEYALTPKAAGMAVFRGLLSVDGTLQPVAGSTALLPDGTAKDAATVAGRVVLDRGEPRFQLQLEGVRGRSLVVEVSEDLVHWFPVSRHLPDTDALEVQDRAPGTSGRRFYRVRFE